MALPKIIKRLIPAKDLENVAFNQKSESITISYTNQENEWCEIKFPKQAAKDLRDALCKQKPDSME